MSVEACAKDTPSPVLRQRAFREAPIETLEAMTPTCLGMGFRVIPRGEFLQHLREAAHTDAWGG